MLSGGGMKNAEDADGVLLDQERLVEDEGVHDEYLPARCCPVAAPVAALVNPLDIGGIKARIGRTGAVTRSHAHEIGISGVITVRFSAERPGMGPGAEVRHSVAKLNDEGDDVHRRGRLPCRWRRPEQPRWASGLRFRNGNDSTPWSSVRSRHCSAALCESRSARCQTLGQPANSLTVCENMFSVAIGATLRTVRIGLRGGHCRTTGGVAGAAGSWIGR